MTLKRFIKLDWVSILVDGVVVANLIVAAALHGVRAEEVMNDFAICEAGDTLLAVEARNRGSQT